MTEFVQSSDFCGFARNDHTKLQPPAHTVGSALADTLAKSQRRLIRYAGLEPFHVLRWSRSRFEALSDLLLATLSQMVRTSGKNYVLALRTPLMEELAKKFFDLGLRFDWIESSSPILTKEVYREWLRPRTGLVIVPWICPYTGVVQPVIDTVEFLKEEGITTIVDASLAMGNLFFELKELKADGYIFEMEGKGTLLATLPTSLWEKNLKSLIDLDEVRQLEGLSIALENRWLDLESRSFERARIKASFEDGIESMGWKVHFRDFDRLGDFSCIETPLHPDHLAYLLQKHDILIDQSDMMSQKIVSFLSDEKASPLLLKWPDVSFNDQLVDKLLTLLQQIQHKAEASAKEAAYVV